MDALWDYDECPPQPGPHRDPRRAALRAPGATTGKPAIFFAAHLAKREIPAVAAAAHGLDNTALFRMPNNRFVARAIQRIRGRTMGKMVASGGAACCSSQRAERNNHIGMLVDQHLHAASTSPSFRPHCEGEPDRRQARPRIRETARSTAPAPSAFPATASASRRTEALDLPPRRRRPHRRPGRHADDDVGGGRLVREHPSNGCVSIDAGR